MSCLEEVEEPVGRKVDDELDQEEVVEDHFEGVEHLRPRHLVTCYIPLPSSLADMLIIRCCIATQVLRTPPHHCPQGRLTRPTWSVAARGRLGESSLIAANARGVPHAGHMDSTPPPSHGIQAPRRAHAETPDLITRRARRRQKFKRHDVDDKIGDDEERHSELARRVVVVKR